MFASGPSRHLFTLWGTSVRADAGVAVLIVMLLSMNSTGGPLGMLVAVPVTVVAVLSLLAHELGHAAAVRALGYGRSEIVLGFLGGYCRWNGTPRPAHRLLVALAGPAVTVVLAGIGFALLKLGPAAALGNPFVGQTIAALAWLNTVWAVFNLLPIHPMDGGQALRSGLQMFWRGAQPIRASLALSAVTAIGVSLLALRANVWVAGLMLGYMAWINVRDLRAMGKIPRLAA